MNTKKLLGSKPIEAFVEIFITGLASSVAKLFGAKVYDRVDTLARDYYDYTKEYTCGGLIFDEDE